MNLPSGWRTKALRQLATINYGRSPTRILDHDGPYPVFGIGGPERFGNAYLYDGDSVVLGRKGTIDRVHYAMGKFWKSDTTFYLSEFKDPIPRWLFYALQTIDPARLNEATGVPSLSRDALYKVEVETPPEPEQAKLADLLATVDMAILQAEALIAKQQRIRIGLMQDLLTRGIDKHGNIRSEMSHIFRDSVAGRMPEEWCIRTLGQLFKERR